MMLGTFLTTVNLRSMAQKHLLINLLLKFLKIVYK